MPCVIPISFSFNQTEHQSVRLHQPGLCAGRGRTEPLLQRCSRLPRGDGTSLTSPSLTLLPPHSTPCSAQPCRCSMARHVLPLAEPTGARLLGQHWLRGVLEERQNMSAWKSACAAEEPISCYLEVSRDQITSWHWPEF